MPNSSGYVTPTVLFHAVFRTPKRGFHYWYFLMFLLGGVGRDLLYGDREGIRKYGAWAACGNTPCGENRVWILEWRQNGNQEPAKGFKGFNAP